jgi:hypothetical protein
LSKARYAFCQVAYMACVSILRASRLAALGVAWVGSGGCVHYLVNHRPVQRETAILESYDIRQRHCICARYQCQMPMDAQTQHLSALVATRDANGQQTGIRRLCGGLLQAKTVGNKSAHRLGITAPKGQPSGWEPIKLLMDNLGLINRSISPRVNH